ncbi:MAG: hypothetical protein QY312_01200 [Candidatus Dojkabacteria bacterium]|nr:MAG: hypothetical protein QY312_01200 [Candidatus Dojkabacteria bacterium]
MMGRRNQVQEPQAKRGSKTEGKNHYDQSQDAGAIRRLILGCMIGIPVGLALGVPIASALSRIFPDEIIAIRDVRDKELTPRQYYHLYEILEARRALQLTTLPERFMEDLDVAQHIHWDGPSYPKYDFDPHKESYAISTAELVQILFGNNAGYFISTISNTTDLLAAGIFDPNERMLTVESNGDPNSQWARFVMVHEGVHAGDYRLMFPETVLPLDKLFEVTATVNQVMKRTTELPNLFFNSETMYHIPSFRKNIGRTVVEQFRQDPNLEGINTTGYGVFLGILEIMMREQQVSSYNEITYNKSVCYRIGKYLFEQMQSGMVELDGDLLWQYQQYFEGASIEVVADAISKAIMFPDSINWDEKMTHLAVQFFSALRDKPLSREDFLHKMEHFHSHRAAERHIFETEIQSATLLEEVTEDPSDRGDSVVEEGGSETVQPTLESPTPAEGENVGDVAAVQDAVRTEKEITRQYWDLIHFGTPIPMPDVVTKKRQEEFAEYIECFRTVYKAYPMVFVATVADDLAFDPPYLHMWETDNVAFAANPQYIWNLVENPALLRDENVRLSDFTRILKNFINHPEFQKASKAQTQKARFKLSQRDLRDNPVLAKIFRLTGPAAA